MRSATLRMALIVPVVLMTLVAVVPTGEAASTFFCHNPGSICRGIFGVLGTATSFEMTGSPAVAVVDDFTDPATSRTVTWTNFEMKGTTEKGEAISATLDSRSHSSGTVLSVGTTEFPATATMRFFFRIETGGMGLVSKEPAVFQGIIHSIPPGPRDSLTLIGPVEFHPEGAPDQVIGKLEKSTVSFNNPEG